LPRCVRVREGGGWGCRLRVGWFAWKAYLWASCHYLETANPGKGGLPGSVSFLNARAP
jgi:hypothetical protein